MTPKWAKRPFRSKGSIDVNKFARAYFHGGGHMNAAGGKSTEKLNPFYEKLELIPPLQSGFGSPNAELSGSAIGKPSGSS